MICSGPSSAGRRASARLGSSQKLGRPFGLAGRWPVITDILAQAKRELGVLRLLGECTLVPLALVGIVSALMLATGGGQ